MDRRRLLIAGGSLMALAACASTGTGGAMTGVPAYTPTSALTEEARLARAVLPAQTPRAELLQPWTGQYDGVAPFDRVTPATLREAIMEGIELQRADINAIANNPEAPTFANTLVALELAGEPLDRALNLMGVMTSNIGGEQWDALDTETAPLLSAASDEITFNPQLFARIKAVADGADTAGLNAEQTRLAERRRDAYIRNGAALDAAGKAELGRINTALSTAFTGFGQKVVADENTWTLLANEAQVAGLPDSNKAAAAGAARSRNLTGWAIVNTRSSVDPYLTFADDRAGRETVWKKFVMRGDNGDRNDTKATIAEILKLRQQRARLLGFANHAEWRMQDTMAKTPAAAEGLMARVWEPAKARVAEEVADMRAIAGHEIEPWDYLYYAEKVRKQKYDLDQNELKPYFELSAVKRGAFDMAGRLYGYSFTPLPKGAVATFHEDVEVFEVRDAQRENRLVGLFYSDDFARAGKRSGAWMTTYRSYSKVDGGKTILASNNNNFTKPEPGQPVLISLDDAETLFHEFGHALHYLSSEVSYPSYGNTPRDFVEYPSQVHEHWVLSRPILDGFMRHYQTGEAMPQALVEKVQTSSTFNQGYATVSYLSSALVDMDLHTQATPPTDIAAFERDSLARFGMPKEIVMRHRLPQFNHLFTSDAYSAGYYSYLWSEVMDADTWALFEEKGVFDPDTARRYKTIILAPGNTTDRAEAYRAFRGRDPDVAALLRVRGFPVS